MAKKKILVEKRNILNDIIAREFTMQELRLFSIYLGRINPRNTATRQVRIPLKTFYKVMDLQSIRIEYLKDITRNLLAKVVCVPTSTGGYNQFQLFKECRVDEDAFGKWYFEIDAHDKALSLMFDYKRDYFTYELWNVLNLESVNQFRMYELLKAYEKRGGERIISVTELREMLGIEKNEYQKFNDFKRFVLNACQKALEAKTDICYTYEPYARSGRGGRIQSLRFTITKNAGYTNQLKLDEFIGMEVIERIRREGTERDGLISGISALDFISEPITDMEKSAILQAYTGDINRIKANYETAKRQGNIKNLVGWLKAGAKTEINQPVEVKQPQKKNRFVNFTQRDIDFAELEQLEFEQLKKSLGAAALLEESERS